MQRERVTWTDVERMVATLLRRREIQQAVPDAGRLNLAPLGPRALARIEARPCEPARPRTSRRSQT